MLEDAPAAASSTADAVSSPEPVTTAHDAPAASSAAPEGVRPSLADHLAATLAPKDGEEATGASPDADEKPAEAAEGQKPEDKPAEKSEDEKLPFHKHPRWMQITAENRELRPLRDEVVNLRQEVERSRAARETVNQLQSFCEQHSITRDEFNRTLDLMRLVKTNPAAAFDALSPILENLALAAGKKLPGDLHKDVEEGMITEERAAELAKERATRARLEAERAQAEQRQQAAQQAAQQRAEQQRVAAVSESLSTLERTWMSSDPDYAQVAARVRNDFKLWALEHRMQTGTLPNQQDAVAKVSEIKEAAIRELRRLVPQPKAPVQRPPQGRSSAVSTSTKPASSLAEHLKNTMAAMGG